MVILYLLKVLATKNHAFPWLQRLPWNSINFPVIEARRSIGRPRSSDPLQKPAPSNGQGHPFTDPLRTPLRTQEGRFLSHSIHYLFTVAAEPITRHVSAPENDSHTRRTRRTASEAIQSLRRHTSLEGAGQIFSPLNSGAGAGPRILSP